MRKLLSLPPNLVGAFHQITGYDNRQWFCSNDPVGRKLGSGGGSVWLLRQCYEHDCEDMPFEQWLTAEKRILLHAGGQSRRLPAYAPAGKVLTPLPVFRWERGQRLSQDLLSLQMPLFEQIMAMAPETMHTMIVSGDVLIRATKPLAPIPEADVVCYGLWLDDEVASAHGVFVSERTHPTDLKCMLQKPSVDTLKQLQNDHFYLTDIGVWLLSDKAVEALRRHCENDGEITNYDLYGQFGCALGSHPVADDPAVNELKVVVLPLEGGEFYHFGTSREIISSMLAIQNLVSDQREIMHRSRKPCPSLFVQNSELWIKMSEENRNIWIENSCVSESWKVSRENIITGVPQNAWEISILPGQCVDIVPVGDDKWAVRPYGFDDAFRGELSNPHTTFIGAAFEQWASLRGISLADIEGREDLQSACIFPVVDNVHDMGLVLRWMLNMPQLEGGFRIWRDARRLSADQLSNEANLVRLSQQREEYRKLNWAQLATNYRHSVFTRSTSTMPLPLSLSTISQSLTRWATTSRCCLG